MAQREWVPVYTSILASEKYLDLSLRERGAWLHVLLLGAVTKPEGQFRRKALARLLDREVADEESDTTGEALVAALVSTGLLDEDGETVSIHDRDDWQRTMRGPSDDPEVKRLREQARYWKEQAEIARSSGGLPDSAEPVEPVTSLREPVIEERRGEEGEESRREEGSDPFAINDRDPYMVACQRLGFIPQSPDFAGEWDALARTFGVEAVIEAIGRTKPTRKPWDMKKEAEMILVSERRRRSRSAQRLAQGETKPPQDPNEIARIMDRNRESAREARKALLLSGTVAPTRPGDEDLLKEAKEEADAGRG